MRAGQSSAQIINGDNSGEKEKGGIKWEKKVRLRSIYCSATAVTDSRKPCIFISYLFIFIYELMLYFTIGHLIAASSNVSRCDLIGRFHSLGPNEN